MDRRQFMQASAATVAVTAADIKLMIEQQDTIEAVQPTIICKVASQSAEITGSKYFPIRYNPGIEYDARTLAGNPKGYLRPGDIVVIVTEWGLKNPLGDTGKYNADARTYVVERPAGEEKKRAIAWRLCAGLPEPPAQLVWRHEVANITIYIPPGALINRAIWRVKSEPQKALMDVRQATLINAAFSQGALPLQEIIEAEQGFRSALRHQDEEYWAVALRQYLDACRLMH